MNVAKQVLQVLRTWQKMPAGELARRLHISRPTLARAIRSLDTQVVVRGKARRTAYAARRDVRGNRSAIALFRIDQDGAGSRIGTIDPVYPQGCAMRFEAPFGWPLIDDMREGWFPSLPYPLDDMRPQGFLGRHFARSSAAVLQVSENQLLA